MILRFFQRAVALVHAKCVSKIKSAVSIDIECRHAAGFDRAQVQTWQACTCCRRCADSVGLYTNSIAIKTKTEIRDETCAQRERAAQSQALISVAGTP